MQNTEELYAFMANASATLDLHVEESENAGKKEQQDVSISNQTSIYNKKVIVSFAACMYCGMQ